MAAVNRVLIVGAGIGGLTLAIALRERGIAVDVVEIEARVIGVGITLTGSTLRALDVIGLAAGVSSADLASTFSRSAMVPANSRLPIRCLHPCRGFLRPSECSARSSRIS